MNEAGNRDDADTTGSGLYDSILGQFEEAWRSGSRPKIEEYLRQLGVEGPTLATATALALLVDLIGVDLEYRWRATGQGSVAESSGPSLQDRQLEAYLARWPRLKHEAELLVKLLGEEYRDRQRWGDRPGHASYVERFPAHRDALLAELGRIDRALQPDPTPKQPARLAVLDGSPRVIGDYELLEVIGRGGMGVVYKARQKSPVRIVALKMVLMGGDASETDLQRFHLEAEAVGNLDHPNIVPIYESGVSERQPFFSMKWIDGGSLAQHDGGFRDQPRAAVLLLVEIAAAVDHAHQRGILHRDLKPANILLEKRGPSSFSPFVTDFGLAKRIGASGSLTQSGAAVGTPSYMAPEQAAGQRHGLTTAADVYSLGAILYELLTGQPPFQADTPLETVLQVLEREPVSLSSLNPRIDRDLNTIVLKCLDKAPGRRYPSAALLADDLRRWLDGRPIQARPVGVLERGVRWVKRRPGVALVAAISTVAALLLVGFGVGFWVWSDLEVRKANGVAEGEKITAQNERTNAELARGDADREKETAQREARQNRERFLRLTALTGENRLQEGDLSSALLYFSDALTLDTDQPVRDPIHVLRAAVAFRQGPSLVQVWSHPRAVSHVEFSPDGGAVLVAGLDGTAQVWDTASGAARFAQPLRHAQAINHAVFSPDGKSILTGSDDRSARVWDTVTGLPRTGVLQLDQPVVHVSFHPKEPKVLAVGGVRFDRTHYVSEPGVPITRMVPMNVGPNSPPIMVPQTTPGPPMNRQERPEGEAQVWDAETGKTAGKTMSLDGWMEHAAFSPDGQLVAGAGGQDEGDSEVEVWEWATGKTVGEPLEHSAHVHRVAFSPDGSRLLTASGTPGSSQGEAQVWDFRTGKVVGRPLKHNGPVTSATFSPDGRRVLTASHDHTARVWDARTGDPLTPPLRHKDALATAWFSPDGRHVLTASRDGTARVWDAHSGEAVTPLLRHAGALTCAAFSPDGRRLVAADRDGQVRLWDLAGIAYAQPAFYHQNVMPPPAGNTTYTERRNGPEESVQRSRANLGDLVVSAAVVSPDGRHVLTAAGTHVRETIAGEGRPHVAVEVKAFALGWWDATTGRLQRQMAHDLPATSAVLSQDGTRLATVVLRGSKDEIGVRLWDLKNDRLVVHRPLTGGATVKAIAFTPDGQCYFAALIGKPPAAAGQKPVHELVVRDVDSDAEVVTLPLDGPLEFVTFGPDVSRLVMVTLSRGPEKTAPRFSWQAQVWDLANHGRRLGQPLSHDHLVTCVVLSPDGRHLLAYGSGVSAFALDHKGIRETRAEAVVSLWELEPEGASRRHRLEHGDAVTSACFSPDGRHVVTTSLDRTARVWSAVDGTPVTPALEHQGRVNHAAFGPDGLLATASGDRTACLWRLPTGDRAAPPFRHRDEVLHVAFGPGPGLITSCADGTARLWDLTPDVRSPDDLKKLAQLLSGERLDATRGVTALDRQTLNDLWQELRQRSPDGFRGSSERTIAWHRDEAADAERTGDWSAVVPHLEQLTVAEPRDGSYRVRLARAHARLEHWDRAEESYAAALDLGMDEPMLWHALAILQVHRNRLDDYRATCARFLDRFGGTSDPGIAQMVVGACVMAPDAVVDFGPVLRLAEKAGGSKTDGLAPGNLLGAALYRAGRFEDALQKLNGKGKTLDASGPWDGFFLSLVEQRLGHGEEARKHRDKAGQQLSDQAGYLFWTERLSLQSLAAETESASKEGPP